MSDQPESLVLQVLQQIRKDLADQRAVLLGLSDATRRLERRVTEGDLRLAQITRRIGEVTAEMELMLKTELMGQFANLETRLELQIDRLAARITALEGERP